MVGWNFSPFIFPLLFCGGVGKLRANVWLPENVAVMCNWLFPLRVTGKPVGFSRVDFDETMIVYEAVGSLLQVLFSQLQQKRRCYISGKSQQLYPTPLYPGPFIMGVNSGHWGQPRSGWSWVSRHSAKTTNLKICPLIWSFPEEA